MARTSKRYMQKEENQTASVIYRAGIYTRLSNERTEEWRAKSSSIETQILVCKDYAKKENIDVIATYDDYEYSGTNFERPKFKEMMEDIKERKINCIIIRDLSRLGREYLEMGRLIDKVFPFLGVRFISVNDKLDTIKNIDSKKSFEVTLKNIINDLYAKDISKKVISSKHNKARNGYFIGSTPPFGYKVEKLKEGQKLFIDEKIRFIVEEMFALAMAGKSYCEIARTLNEKGYATAMTYHRTGRIYREKSDPQWHKGTIAKIITNPTYAGTLRQGVKRQDLSKGLKRYFAKEEDWIIFENAHEPYITKEEHEKLIQDSLNRRQTSRFQMNRHDFERDHENRYKGLVFNHNTGKLLIRKTRIYGINKDRFYYTFENDLFNGVISDEEKVFIFERDLDKALVEKVSSLLLKVKSQKKMLEQLNALSNEVIGEKKEKIIMLSEQIYKEESLIQKQYENYSLSKIDKEDYLEARAMSKSRIETLRNEIKAIENKILKIKKQKRALTKWLEDLLKVKDNTKLPSDLIHDLVDKVIVYKSHEFEIVFKFDFEKIGEIYE